MQKLKRVLIICFVLLMNGFILWFFFAAGPLVDRIPAILGAPPFFIGPLGTIWMLYDSFRYERKPWPYAIVAFVPYVFIWHYFEHVRKRGPAEKMAIAHRRKEGHSQAD